MDLKNIRLNAGLTQVRMAALIGITTRTYQNWELYDTYPKWLDKFEPFLLELVKKCQTAPLKQKLL